MTYKTKITLGRDLSPYELNLVNSAIDYRSTVAQTTDGLKQVLGVDNVETRAVVRTWTTMEAAEEWVSFFSQFAPAKEEIIVEE